MLNKYFYEILHLYSAFEYYQEIILNNTNNHLPFYQTKIFKYSTRISVALIYIYILRAVQK